MAATPKPFVRYRVVAKSFVGDTLRYPGDEFDGPPGLEGRAIERIMEPAPVKPAAADKPPLN